MKITSFGEVLWDNLPSGKKLGGAPLNVLVRLRALGADCAIISSRGADADGDEIQRQIEGKDVSTALLQVCPDQPTSLVEVKINNCGVATYDIVYPCAWDRIELREEALTRVAESDAFMFGSLCTRDPVTRRTLETILDRTAGTDTFKVFDVNLRRPHYTHERVLSLMKRADMAKLNDDELYELAVAFGSKHRSIDQNVRFLARLAGLERLCAAGPAWCAYLSMVSTLRSGCGRYGGLGRQLPGWPDLQAAQRRLAGRGAGLCLCTGRHGGDPHRADADDRDRGDRALPPPGLSDHGAAPACVRPGVRAGKQESPERVPSPRTFRPPEGMPAAGHLRADLHGTWAGPCQQRGCHGR